MIAVDLSLDALTAVPVTRDTTAGIAVSGGAEWAQVILARAERNNALNLAMWRQLAATFTALADDPEIRVVILRGVGGTFSVGSDIGEFKVHRLGMAAAAEYNGAIAGALRAIMDFPSSVIAMIDGAAVGGGCEIACACDLRIASDRARFGMPIARLGVSIGPDEARALLRVLPRARIREMLLTARILASVEAQTIGLIDVLATRAGLPAATLQTAIGIAKGAPLGHRANKVVLDAVAEGRYPAVAPAVERVDRAIYDGPDFIEGIDAFLAKRQPRFTQTIAFREHR